MFTVPRRICADVDESSAIRRAGRRDAVTMRARNFGRRRARARSLSTARRRRRRAGRRRASWSGAGGARPATSSSPSAASRATASTFTVTARRRDESVADERAGRHVGHDNGHELRRDARHEHGDVQRQTATPTAGRRRASSRRCRQARRPAMSSSPSTALASNGQLHRTGTPSASSSCSIAYAAVSETSVGAVHGRKRPAMSTSW